MVGRDGRQAEEEEYGGKSNQSFAILSKSKLIYFET